MHPYSLLDMMFMLFGLIKHQIIVVSSYLTGRMWVLFLWKDGVGVNTRAMLNQTVDDEYGVVLQGRRGDVDDDIPEI